MFKVSFPDSYNKYSDAFQAGVWLRKDPGLFLGRAVIYKLQGRLHKDQNDIGPSASFEVRKYTGAEMLFPQLKAKFSYVYPHYLSYKHWKLLPRYDPGHVCIFYSSKIFHKVAKFHPAVQTSSEAEQSITPGRIGSVFFFPSASYHILKDKREGWGYQTAFGRNKGLVEV